MGLLGFVSAGLETMQLAIAVVILASAVVLWIPSRSETTGSPLEFRSRSAVATGFLAGAMTSSIGMAGPPLVLYLTALRSDKNALRASALCFFVFAYGITAMLMAATTGFERRVWEAAVVLVPLAAVGAVVGHRAAPHVPERGFRTIVLLLIAAAAAYVLVTTLSS